jgi:hypothetical protein
LLNIRNGGIPKNTFFIGSGGFLGSLYAHWLSFFLPVLSLLSTTLVSFLYFTALIFFILSVQVSLYLCAHSCHRSQRCRSLYNTDLFVCTGLSFISYVWSTSVRVSFLALFCCRSLVWDCRSWASFYVVCVVCLWFAPPRSKMRIASRGQTYYAYNLEGIGISLVHICSCMNKISWMYCTVYI